MRIVAQRADYSSFTFCSVHPVYGLMLAFRTRVASLAALLLLGACAEGSRVVAPSADVGASARFNGGAVTGPRVVISQVYGGGGNSGAPLPRDFVELFNRGDAPATLSGMSLQYASATGTGNLGNGATQILVLAGTLQPGQYLLVQMAGTSGTTLTPAPDLIGTINLAGASGKIALVNSTTSLGCNGGSTPCSAAQTALIVDLVGFGGANFFEGAGATPTLSNATAALRGNAGCTDTDNNSSDFVAGTPAPRNSTSPLKSCDATAPAVVASVTVEPSAATTVVGGAVVLTAVARDANNGVVAGQTFTWLSSDPAVATVNASGVVSALAVGTTDITAAVGAVVSAPTTITVNAPAPVPAVRFSELHYDNTSLDVNERIEIEGPAGTDLTGWRVLLYNGDGGAVYNTQLLSGAIPATCGARGVVVVDYPPNGIQNGPDGLALVDASNTVVEFLSYEGTFLATDGPAVGTTSTDILVSELGNTPYGFSLQRNAAGTAWAAPAPATFGGCNGTGVAPTQPGFIEIFGRNPPGGTDGDPPLPVGFQSQIFGTARNSLGVSTGETVIWTTDTPGIASVDNRGVITGVSAGSAVFRATSSTATATYVLPIDVAVSSVTASYLGNTEFGIPTDATPADDYIVERVEYTSSWNGPKGIPNWVSYNLEATHFGTEDRCECFTFDPLLPANFQPYTTADYTGASAAAGYSIARGHLTRSADRTSGNLDNARSFYFTNIFPQSAEMNGGPWALLENYLGDLARNQNREVYIITGTAGSQGTVKNEGRITIPSAAWKVAVILPRNAGLADVTDRNNAEVIAVIMPNNASSTGAWQQYQTTVDAVEALSGYDLLALLPDNIEEQIERGNRFPTAVLDGPFNGTEGSAIAMSAAGSSDPDLGSVLSYAWSFGDGTTATGAAVNKTYVQDGSYIVTLTVTDEFGASHKVTTTAVVANVVPVVTLTPAATWKAGVSSSLGVKWTDPAGTRDAPYRVRIEWGDGSAATQFSSLTVPVNPLTRLKAYSAPGQYTVTVTVTDRNGGVGTQTLLITVAP